MRRRDWLLQATQQLKAASVESATLVAHLILGHVLDLSRERLIAHDDLPVHAPELAQANRLLARRLAGEPLAYLVGQIEFHGHSFIVGPEVLIPRSETELLVDAVLARAPVGRKWRLVDVGTGSGCIPITVALENPHVEAIGVDVSEDALGVAYENVWRHRLTDRVRLFSGDMFEPVAELPEWQGAVDIVASNPPYIDPAERSTLRPEVLCQPPAALFAGAPGTGGVAMYDRLLRDSVAWLKPGGWLIVELGIDQAEAVTHMAATIGGWNPPDITADWAGIPRIFACQRSPHPTGPS